MADNNLSTVEEELSELGIVARYIWKPHRVYAKYGNDYISIDVVADGSASDVSTAVYNEGQKQINEIDALATAQKAEISKFERDYASIKDNLRSSYEQMYNYFIGQNMIALATIMATAIVNLSLM